AQQWTAGCRNIPKQDIGELITPFPLSVSVIANNVWKYNGDLAQGKTAVIRMKPYQGIELLLGLLSKDIRFSILHFTLSNSLGLIAYLGNFLHGGSRATDNSEVKKAKLRMNDAMLVLSFLGLLLYQSKIEKENYMEELAFLIGQFLHISDELHALYCQNKRDGQIPPQLAGNALFVAAGTTPIQALAQLSTRMNPYVAWAKQYRFENVEEKGKESWRARWLLNLFEQLSDKIASKINNDIRFGDYDRAQLFIGYMASLPITKKDGSTEILKEENSIGGENE
ncbi:MAG: hypothetical protein GX800_13215, partial [Clostridiaceae bacterium]|nr:hypothetical protein [Clostridiaceae bacterium]